MYFIIGALEVVCVISSFMLPETKNADLDDKITHWVKYKRLWDTVWRFHPSNGNQEFEI